MPGLAGCIRLQPEAPPPPCPAPRFADPLSREPDYHCALIAGCDDVAAIALGPELAEPVVGAALDEASGIHAGFYGEFYGPEFRELDGAGTARRLIREYQRHGLNLPAALDGSFLIFVWDSRSGLALLANDHAGSRPVYYAEQNGHLYFSPEPKGIARLPGVRTTIDQLALLAFLSQGNLLECQTYYREIRALPPGSALRIGRGRVELHRHYRYTPCAAGPGRGMPAYIDELAPLLRAAVAKRAHHLRRAVIPISGGFDSRGILACLSEISGSRLRTVSWGTDETTLDADAAIGRSLAERFGTEHRFLRRDPAVLPRHVEEMVARVDGMTADPALHYPELQFMRLIRGEMKGEYLFRGDEVFGYHGAAADEREALARVGIRDISELPALARILSPAAPLARFSELLAEISAECPLANFTARKDYHYFYQRTFNYLHRATYYKLTVLDVGNPWLDKDILDFYRTVPVSYRVDKLLYRRTLESMFPELAVLPIARRHSLENWTEVLAGNAALQRFLRKHLVETGSPVHELVDRGALERLLAAAASPAPSMAAVPGLLAAARRLSMQRAPALYSLLKRSAPRRFRVAAVSPHELLFRALVLKLWFDRNG